MELQGALDAEELATLLLRWGAPPLRQVALTVDDPFLTGNHQLLTSAGRRAEICYVMHQGDPARGLLLHIKTYYPEGAYRLPTGGIMQGEGVVDTLGREIYEETGLILGDGTNEVRLERLLGVLAYDLYHRRIGPQTFATYFFLVRMPPGAELNPTDPEESIGGWQWRPAADLPAVAEVLDEVGRRASDWADWGRFRAVGHRYLAELLGAAGA